MSVCTFEVIQSFFHNTNRVELLSSVLQNHSQHTRTPAVYLLDSNASDLSDTNTHTHTQTQAGLLEWCAFMRTRVCSVRRYRTFPEHDSDDCYQYFATTRLGNEQFHAPGEWFTSRFISLSRATAGCYLSVVLEQHVQREEVGGGERDLQGRKKKGKKNRTSQEQSLARRVERSERVLLGSMSITPKFLGRQLLAEPRSR